MLAQCLYSVHIHTQITSHLICGDFTLFHFIYKRSFFGRCQTCKESYLVKRTVPFSIPVQNANSTTYRSIMEHSWLEIEQRLMRNFLNWFWQRRRSRSRKHAVVKSSLYCRLHSFLLWFFFVEFFELLFRWDRIFSFPFADASRYRQWNTRVIEKKMNKKARIQFNQWYSISICVTFCIGS